MEIQKKVNILKENKLNILTTDKIEFIIKNKNLSQINKSIVGHYPNVIRICKIIFDDTFWEEIIKHVNQYWARKNKNNFKKHYTKYFSKKVFLYLPFKEILNLVGCHFLTSKLNEKSLTKRYEELLEEYGLKKKNNNGKLIFTVETFLLFNGHFGTDDLLTIIDIIYSNSRKAIIIAPIIASDEITIPYEPHHNSKEESKRIGWEIPHLYIEHKPNKNCFWIDAACVTLEESGLCYVIILEPFFKQPQKQPIEIILKYIKILKDKNKNFKFCLIMDARYDTKKVIEKFIEEDEYFIIGCNKARHSGLEIVLSESLDINEWRMVNNDINISYSVRMQLGKNDKRIIHFVSTNCFKVIKEGKYILFILK
jgi:hypothetical protein